MSSIPKLWLLSGIVSYSYFFPNLTMAQVVPDGTTPTNIVGDCLTQCNLRGGIQAEKNLFHSFQEFNIGVGESVYFIDPGVANIFSRVTGHNASEIFGTLGVRGGANLWLINPQGILFGNGATLDLNGSFVATTADEIVFGDRGIFSTNPDSQENLPLLTVNPSAFFYRQMDRGNPITVEEASLAVPDRESLVLLGAQNRESTDGVFVQGATIEASQGNIQIGAVAAQGIVEINPDLQLQFPKDIIRGNITLAQDSEINVNGLGGGSITIEAAELNIIEDSVIRSATLGNIDSGDIRITTQKLNLDRGLIHSLTFGTGKSADLVINTETLNISGQGIAEFQELVSQAISGNLTPGTEVTGIATSTSNLGSAGNISISSNNISVTNGGFIASVTYGEGKGSEIGITATETINLNSSGLLSFSAFNSSGDSGDLKIDAQKLIVRDGSLVSAGTLGQGAGGDINIQATESVELLRTPTNYLLPTTIFTNSVFPHSGDAGNLVIDTKNLIIQGGAQISSASGLLTNEGIIPFGGRGGDINIQATEFLKIDGSSANGIFPSSIISDTRSDSPAGNVNIDTGAFLLEGQAVVSASSIGNGNGGNLTINATESIQLSGQGLDDFFKLIDIDPSNEEISLADVRGGLYSFTFDGNAGDLNLKTPVLSLNNGSLITTATIGTGNGGNINIETSETVEIINSLIASSSLNTGDAGNVTIDTSNLIIRNAGTLATATIGLGKAGEMTINATELVELSSNRDFALPRQGGILTSNSGAGLGRSGDLNLKTKNLIIRDGLNINIANENQFQVEAVGNNIALPNNALPIQIEPGNSIITATESIKVSGSSVNGEFVSSINSSTETNLPANNIQIFTPQLTISENAEISVSSSGGGAAGSLEIFADKIYLESGGTLNASTLSGQGGNINLQLTDRLQLSDRANITTNALDRGNGGNITIKTEFLIAFPGSSITANAIAGNGGNIKIEAQDIFIAAADGISASSQLGIDGEVKISTFTSDLRHNLAKLPQKILTQENQMVSSCGTGDEFGEGSFVYIGRGALPPNPLEGKIEREEFLVDFGTEATQLQLYPLNKPQNPAIIEATGWKISDRGKVILTAEKPANNLTPYNQTECPF